MISKRNVSAYPRREEAIFALKETEVAHYAIQIS
jgi:hypothetical protein